VGNCPAFFLWGISIPELFPVSSVVVVVFFQFFSTIGFLSGRSSSRMHPMALRLTAIKLLRLALTVFLLVGSIFAISHAASCELGRQVSSSDPHNESHDGETSCDICLTASLLAICILPALTLLVVCSTFLETSGRRNLTVFLSNVFRPAQERAPPACPAA
jgi:hypothetical protein